MSEQTITQSKSFFRIDDDTRAFLVYALSLIAAVGALVVWSFNTGWWDRDRALPVLTWIAFCVLANLLPMPAGRNIHLSMSGPTNIAVAYLFHPGAAALILFVGTLSEWEIKRETTLLHAAFNRSQVALAAAGAAAMFRVGLHPIVSAVLAVALYQFLNFLFVGLAEKTSRGVPITTVVRGLLPPGPAAGVAYLALGLMGVVFALTYQRIGAWAVAILMIPLISARHALRVSRDLERAEHDRRQLADRIIDERERERVRIASDIHDVALQELAALEIQTENINSAIERGALDTATEMARSTKQTARRVITSLRAAIRNLRRVALDEDGLVPTLERYGRSFHAETGVEIKIESDEIGSGEIPLSVGILLYECCQEALTNVAKHSRASQVLLQLVREGDSVQLKIRDNGVGMNGSSGSQSMGLELMRDKVALSGGGLWIAGKPGSGTEVNVRVPLAKAQS